MGSLEILWFNHYHCSLLLLIVLRPEEISVFSKILPGFCPVEFEVFAMQVAGLLHTVDYEFFTGELELEVRGIGYQAIALKLGF